MVAKNLDDLLDVVPGLRRVRSLSSGMLRVLLDRQKGECTWCGQRVKPPRRLWCSDECGQLFAVRCQPATAAQYVLKTSHGICSLCGRDTIESQRLAQQEIAALQKDERLWAISDWAERGKQRSILILEIRRRYGWERGRFYEVDHNPPVIEYGGLCDPDKLRLLCGQCHASETAKLRARLKRK